MKTVLIVGLMLVLIGSAFHDSMKAMIFWMLVMVGTVIASYFVANRLTIPAIVVLVVIALICVLCIYDQPSVDYDCRGCRYNHTYRCPGSCDGDYYDPK